MKNIRIIICLMFCITALMACDNDESYSSEFKVTPAVINTPAQTNWTLTQPEGDNNPFLFRLNWSKARFSYESGEVAYADSVTYEVEADLLGNEFASSVVIASTQQLYTDLYTLPLNEAITQITGKETNEAQNVEIRVKVSYTGGEAAYSSPITLVVTPYIYQAPPTKLDKLSYIYIIGDMNGWDTTNKDFMMYRNSSDLTDGVYTYTGYFAKGAEGCYFKFCAEENMGGYDKMYCAGADGVLKFGDEGAFFVDPGYYTVSIDLINMTWTIASYDASNAKSYTKIGPIGEFCNWDNEPALTASTFDAHQWSGVITFTTSTTCKFRGNNDWANNWGGKAAEYPYGKAIFDGPGASVGDAGDYEIRFNDLTGNYIIRKR